MRRDSEKIASENVDFSNLSRASIDSKKSSSKVILTQKTPKLVAESEEGPQDQDFTISIINKYISSPGKPDRSSAASKEILKKFEVSRVDFRKSEEEEFNSQIGPYIIE